MADNTKIEWTDMTWNPITGCSVVSPGCTNCYAMKLAGERLKNHVSRAGLTRDTKAGPVWTGEVRFNEAWLDQPLRKTKPRMIFVCAHGDLFAEGVPDAWIDRIFAVMALAPQHTFQVLTKRAARMRDYLRGDDRASNDEPHQPHQRILAAAAELIRNEPDSSPRSILLQDYCESDESPLPLPNVWLGVSTEDQRRADERVPLLLDTPAAVRWVSAEPLLGPIDFRPYMWASADLDGTPFPMMSGPRKGEFIVPAERLDWIVAGGESGPGARWMLPDWVRPIRDDCAAAGVAFLLKQWGEWHPWGQQLADGNFNLLSFGEDPARYQHLEGGVIISRVGKKDAGRFLDGVQHDGYPMEASRG